MTNCEYKYRAKLVAEAHLSKTKQQYIMRGALNWESRYGLYRFGKIVHDMELVMKGGEIV